MIVLFTFFGSVANAQSLSLPLPPKEEIWIQPSESTGRGKPLLTSWGADVTPDNVHPEYPRPTLFRSDYHILNGYWSWKDISEKEFTRRILVPFPVESMLSGIAQRTERCVYRRTFTIPHDWPGESHILLHFGAVDWEATVFINGQQVGSHRGGYDPFSFDITPFIHRNEPNEIVVSVFDPSQRGEQPRGKQSANPSNIWYTASSGIWQTVWLEPVPQYHITSLQIHADYDTGQVTILPTVNAIHKDLTIVAEAFDGEKTVAQAFGGCDGPLLMRFNRTDIKPWSPDSPHLYQLRIQLLRKESQIDKVGSYFAFRKIETVRDQNGYPVVYLNGKRLFLMGVIDQGYWPDGLYTAPSDGAQRMDIQVAKTMGFNVIRKYQKIEPERWYFWCDRLGMLVWQDMPGGENKHPAAKQQFQTELQRMIQSRSHHPSIVTWTIFNEGMGQHNVAEYVDLVRSLDSTRLVNATSGWMDNELGDFNIAHKFPGPAMPKKDTERAAVVGLFGGLTLIPPPEYLWSQDPWGHQHVSDSDSFVERFGQMHKTLQRLIRTQGLAGAFFHQLTDIESECNGLMPYDRSSLKVHEASLEQINSETIRMGSE
ncbi:MAG: hypothetical protein FWH27_19120 [Planctomycetaceae bacterium]|nr:hypothetical protein [Planctomycetaceae bacterium]